MILTYKTLDDKIYKVKLERYQAKPFKKVASGFQYKWKRFWMNAFPKCFWAEEFPCRPLLRHSYRLDLYNFTLGIAIEAHGKQHTELSDHFHGGDHNKFMESLAKDREKELWCEKNGIFLIKVYESTPFNIDFFKNRYKNIRWPN